MLLFLTTIKRNYQKTPQNPSRLQVQPNPGFQAVSSGSDLSISGSAFLAHSSQLMMSPSEGQLTGCVLGNPRRNTGDSLSREFHQKPQD